MDRWLRQGIAPSCAAGTVDTVDPPVVFLFPGEDCAYGGMGRELWETAPAFREALARCQTVLDRSLDRSLLAILDASSAAAVLAKPAYAQPAVFAFQYALVELWKSWGIMPATVLGHGLGQYAAACAAGLFSLEDGLKLVAARGRLIESLAADGRMLAVMAGPRQVAEAILASGLGDAGQGDVPCGQSPPLAIAAVNGPRQTVVSGRTEAIERLAAELDKERIRTRLLPVAHACHSPLREPIAGEFGRVCETVAFHKPRMPIISTVSGKPAGEEIAGADYWRREFCTLLRFADAVAALDEQGCRIFIEIGPQPKLLGLGRRCMRHWAGLWLPSLKRGRADWQVLLSSLAKLYAHGAKIDWAGLHRGVPTAQAGGVSLAASQSVPLAPPGVPLAPPRGVPLALPVPRRVLLPTYPFQRKSYWMADDDRPAASGNGDGRLSSEAPAAPLGRSCPARYPMPCWSVCWKTAMSGGLWKS